MTTRYLDIKGKWGVVVCYNLQRKDARKMRALMESVGMPDNVIDRALRLLLYHENNGMCIGNNALRMSLVFVGEATSEEQWWDTMAHEVLDHVKYAICMYYGVKFGGEDSAWLTGYLMRLIVQQIAPPCQS